MHVEESLAAASDGTRIWWREAGRGAPACLLVDGIACAGFIWRDLFPSLARSRRTLHFNYRGHGRSEVPRDPAAVRVEDAVGDLLAVLDAAGERSAVLLGHSVGVQICLEAHRRAPRRVRGLVLLCGAPGRPLETFHGRRTLAQLFPFVERLVLAAPAAARWAFRKAVPTEVALQLGRWLEVNRHLLRRGDLEAYLQDVAEVDPEVFVRMLASAAAGDATDHLPRVRVPALVVAGARDTWTPLALSRRMHEAIAGSELLVLPEGTHT
ncbi:MAG TPA: alpha/beta hydrolase, partial [Anaeromyxobacteraceae bacterium]|nr:alpha/beta hydrolase [Anaeromyxobacteraceae bacterium]